MELMAGKLLFFCVLIPVLLITVYGKDSTAVNINCPNQKGTVGEPLNITCNVRCRNCKPVKYKWSIEGCVVNYTSTIDIITVGQSYLYHCTIPKASEKHNGTLILWVQTTTGNNETTTNITIVPLNSNIQKHVATDKPPDKLLSFTEPSLSGRSPEERSPTVAVAVIVMFCLSIGILVAILYGKNKTTVYSQCNHSMTI